MAALQLSLVQLAGRMHRHFLMVLERRRWQQHQLVSRLTHLRPAIPVARKSLHRHATVLHARF
ncbi:MAG: hypothetical protein WBP86_11360, partial [Thiobacillaceae bacterium]